MTDALDPETAARVEELSRQLAKLTECKAATVARIRELMAAEDVRAGKTFAKEIFEAQQEKLTLETEMEIARRQRKRLLLPE